MTLRERLLRALAALTAGSWIALEHLTGRDHAPVEVVPECPLYSCCPICGVRMGEAPHVHDEDVIWPTEHEGVVLLTRLDGSSPLDIPSTGSEAT